jgi:putative addiction module component (TIGR02574 family)
MNLTANQVLDAALALSDNDRFELVEALIVSLQPGDRAPIDDLWRDVVLRRSAELRSGQVKPVPGEEVKRHAKNSAS